MERDTSRHDLLTAVEERRREIVERVFVRIQAIGDGRSDIDAEYMHGVRQAVETAVDHTIEASAAPEDRPPAVPAAVLAQARLAARRRTPLETVLRRYLAGHAVLGDFVAEEAERQGVDAALLRQVLRAQAAETDRVLAVISETYRQEADFARPPSSGRRRALQIRRLLDGELLDPSGLGYDLDRWHVGMVAPAATGGDAFGGLAAHPDAARLVVSGNDSLAWGWLGFRERPDPGLSAPAAAADSGEDRPVGIGEAAFGRSGWRLTHEQARAALSVAIRGRGTVIRYADVALVSAALRDELLASSLRSLYLEPLAGGREDGGEVLRGTLRAYLDADRNASSTAAALGVSRNTVGNRLRAIEARIGHLRPSILGDLAVALQLSDLTN